MSNTSLRIEIRDPVEILNEICYGTKMAPHQRLRAALKDRLGINPAVDKELTVLTRSIDSRYGISGEHEFVVGNTRDGLYAAYLEQIASTRPRTIPWCYMLSIVHYLQIDRERDWLFTGNNTYLWLLPNIPPLDARAVVAIIPPNEQRTFVVQVQSDRSIHLLFEKIFDWQSLDRGVHLILSLADE